MNTPIKKRVLKLEPGCVVQYNDVDYIVHALVDTERVLLTSLSGAKVKARISELSVLLSDKSPKKFDHLIAIEDKDWQLAQRRFEIIRPLLSLKAKRTRKDVISRAEENNVSPASVYRWVDTYNKYGVISSLVRSRRSDRGDTRVDGTVEAIISEQIEKHFLNKQRPTIQTVIRHVKEQCKEQGVESPHGNTIRARIQQIPLEIRLRRRNGKDAAHAQRPIRGSFPGADWPLSVVQIDHTKLDIILVDDETREPVGRPYLTLGLDVFSRTVTGFYISFDPPSIFTTGMCITHSVLPKDQWLTEHDLAGPWPVQGVMSVIHVDNAMEFRSPIFERSCHEYNIDLQWRPVGQPHYGAHVERFFSTLNAELHQLPGTTFSNTQERKGYNSDKQSAMTIREFERWLTTFIVDVYHQRYHSEIDTSPAQRYEQGILGNGDQPGIGLPPQVMDAERFRLNFMPMTERVVTPNGVVFEKVHYYHDVLRTWINAKEPGNSKASRKFIFRYDPRNMSCLYFFDPELKEYFRIPFKDTTRPPISLWEIRQVRKAMRASGLAFIDEESIFSAYRKMTELVDESKSSTRKARRSGRLKNERKKDNEIQLNRLAKNTDNERSSVADSNVDEINFDDITPFDDIQE